MTGFGYPTKQGIQMTQSVFVFILCLACSLEPTWCYFVVRRQMQPMHHCPRLSHSCHSGILRVESRPIVWRYSTAFGYVTWFCNLFLFIFTCATILFLNSLLQWSAQHLSHVGLGTEMWVRLFWKRTMQAGLTSTTSTSKSTSTLSRWLSSTLLLGFVFVRVTWWNYWWEMPKIKDLDMSVLLNRLRMEILIGLFPISSWPSVDHRQSA